MMSTNITISEDDEIHKISKVFKVSIDHAGCYCCNFNTPTCIGTKCLRYDECCNINSMLNKLYTDPLASDIVIKDTEKSYINPTPVVVEDPVANEFKVTFKFDKYVTKEQALYCINKYMQDNDLTLDVIEAVNPTYSCDKNKLYKEERK